MSNTSKLSEDLSRIIFAGPCSANLHTTLRLQVNQALAGITVLGMEDMTLSLGQRETWTFELKSRWWLSPVTLTCSFFATRPPASARTGSCLAANKERDPKLLGVALDHFGPRRAPVDGNENLPSGANCQELVSCKSRKEVAVQPVAKVQEALAKFRRLPKPHSPQVVIWRF